MRVQKDRATFISGRILCDLTSLTVRWSQITVANLVTLLLLSLEILVTTCESITFLQYLPWVSRKCCFKPLPLSTERSSVWEQLHSAANFEEGGSIGRWSSCWFVHYAALVNSESLWKYFCLVMLAVAGSGLSTLFSRVLSSVFFVKWDGSVLNWPASRVLLKVCSAVLHLYLVFALNDTIKLKQLTIQD